MYRHVRELQFTAKPEKPDALFAMKFQEILGGQFGEMTVMMQYLWQGWSCRVPGKYKDMIMDIATEEISHVEMLTVMLARLLEGAPGETTEKAAAANPVLAAVLGGQNPQHAIVSGGNAMPTNSQGVPWNTGYIVASGNLLTDFRSNAAAEGQSRLMSSRIANMTDDRGVKEMLAFNLARDTYHQQQWLLGIQQLQEDGFTDGVIEHSNGDWERKDAAHVFYTSTPGSRAGEGLWATSKSLVDGEPFRTEPLEPLTDDTGRAECRRQDQGRADAGLLTPASLGHRGTVADDRPLQGLEVVLARWERAKPDFLSFAVPTITGEVLWHFRGRTARSGAPSAAPAAVVDLRRGRPTSGNATIVAAPVSTSRSSISPVTRSAPGTARPGADLLRLPAPRSRRARGGRCAWP